MRTLLVCIGWLACAAWAAERQTVPTETPRHEVATAAELSQYGITWRFDRPCVVGKFVTGDYWVLGPVRIVAVTPAPGPAPRATRRRSGRTSLATRDCRTIDGCGTVR